MRLLFLLALCLTVFPGLASTPDSRVFQFTYEIPEADFPAGEAVDIYIPMPAEYAGQKILLQDLQSSVPGKRGVEDTNGNAYYHLHRPAGSTIPLSATLSWTVARDAVGATKEALSEEQLAQYLAPDALVPVGHEILKPIQAEIYSMRTDDSQAATARAIYDWVVDNVEYKKVGTGWGNGDTFWACNERYGNCTDFHSLFIALARSEGIPARFEMGFPVPRDRGEGDIGGYHCWVQFYLPERGWVPIDASEAAKHPEQRDALYGGYPADRIHFSTGRDLVISAGSAEAPLNYFIYPYVEIGGKPWSGKIATRFSFAEVKS
ncbi:MAG: transglutaminase domain-containing protein [Halioglobus sp.]|nr:transglutaminase domain-containing protein [Halioglobus sp.]